MTATKDPLAEIPFATNAAIRPSTIHQFVITNSDGSLSLDISSAVADFYFYESVLSNTISATVMIVDTGFLSGNQGGETELINRISTNGIISSLKLVGGERVDFKIEHSNPKIRGDKAILEYTGGMYINRIREISNNSLKDVFALDLVPEEFISNEKTRVVGRYDGKISDNIRNILGGVLKTTLPITVNKTASTYNFIGNDRKPFYICTWLASKSIPEGNDKDGKPMVGGGAGYLFYQTRDSFQFRSLDRLMSTEPNDTINSDEKIRKFIYNNTGKNVDNNQYDEADSNILNYSFNRTVDIGKELSLGTYNNRSIFFDPFSMNYSVKIFTSDDQRINYLGSDRNIPTVKNITDTPTRLMSHVLDVGVMPDGTDSNSQLSAWKQSLVETNFDAQDIMVQSIMRYNQLFSIQLNITIPGDFSISAGDRVACKFQDLRQSDEENNQLSGIYMVSSVCHKVTSEDTFSSIDLVSDSLGTVKAKLTNSFLN